MQDIHHCHIANHKTRSNYTTATSQITKRASAVSQPHRKTSKIVTTTMHKTVYDLLPGSSCTKPKLHRRATYWWLRCLDHALTLLTGSGLEQFATDNTPQSSYRSDVPSTPAPGVRAGRPCKTFTVGVDQHGSGLTGDAFMKHLVLISIHCAEGCCFGIIVSSAAVFRDMQQESCCHTDCNDVQPSGIL